MRADGGPAWGAADLARCHFFLLSGRLGKVLVLRRQHLMVRPSQPGFVPVLRPQRRPSAPDPTATPPRPLSRDKKGIAVLSAKDSNHALCLRHPECRPDAATANATGRTCSTVQYRTTPLSEAAGDEGAGRGSRSAFLCRSPSLPPPLGDSPADCPQSQRPAAILDLLLPRALRPVTRYRAGIDLAKTDEGLPATPRAFLPGFRSAPAAGRGWRRQRQRVGGRRRPGPSPPTVPRSRCTPCPAASDALGGRRPVPSRWATASFAIVVGGTSLDAASAQSNALDTAVQRPRLQGGSGPSAF